MHNQPKDYFILDISHQYYIPNANWNPDLNKIKKYPIIP